MKTKRQHPLVGRWHSPEWSSIEITIRQLKTTLQIRAVDLEDGEKLQIKNKSLDDKTVSFDLYTPSTGHTCHHLLSDKGGGTAHFEITWSEEWVLKEE